MPGTINVIKETRATELLRTHYGLNGKLTRLGGDRDANFMAELESGQRYVFKVMHPQCAGETVQLQCAALQHLSHSRLKLPTVIASLRGNAWETISEKGADHIIWVLSWCPGTSVEIQGVRVSTLTPGFRPRDLQGSE